MIKTGTHCVHIYYSKFIDVNKDQNNNNILENIFIIYALFFFHSCKIYQKNFKIYFFLLYFYRETFYKYKNRYDISY